MENEIKTQRNFLLIIGGAFAVFMLMLFFYTQTGTANTGQQTNQAGAIKDNVAALNGGVQDVYIKALSSGIYDKQQVTVKKGIPVRLHFSAEKGAGCGKMLIMKKFGVQLLSANEDEKVAEFTPTETGSFEYSCSMRMFRGTLTVVA